MGSARKLVVQVDMFAEETHAWAIPADEVEAKPLGSKSWRGASLVLWQRMTSPMQWADLMRWAERVQWSADRVRNTLAVLEGDGRAEAVEDGGVVVWRRRQDA